MFSFSVLKCSPPMFFCRLTTLSRIILLLRMCSPRSQNNHVFISDASYKYICTYYVCTYNYLCHSLQEHFTIKVKLKRKLRKDSSDWKALLFHSFLFHDSSKLNLCKRAKSCHANLNSNTKARTAGQRNAHVVKFWRNLWSLSDCSTADDASPPLLTKSQLWKDCCRSLKNKTRLILTVGAWWLFYHFRIACFRCLR